VEYKQPDWDKEALRSAPDVGLSEVKEHGIMPEDLYLTTNHPTYVKHNGKWMMARDQMMDSCIVLEKGEFYVREYWHIPDGSRIVTGSMEDASEGIYVHEDGFKRQEGTVRQNFSSFAFMSSEVSREHPIPYDQIAEELMQHRGSGYVIWVLGPAVTHSRGRRDMAWLIDHGFVDVLFGGNAVATHDLETALLGTTLGMDSQGCPVPGGHRHHDDTINKIRSLGSMERAVELGVVTDGIMYSCIRSKIPYVLAGSIRDNGPIPGVITDVFAAQDVMREHTKKATLVCMVATLLHSVATGNMLPTFYQKGDSLRPLNVICVDQEEFNLNKLRDRGTHQSLGVVTNAQDFLRILVNELKLRVDK
jgi:lysine-ketoglutarate reductase/saccharopine dehydrogenase-like protein (TIGR00300 family)